MLLLLITFSLWESVCFIGKSQRAVQAGHGWSSSEFASDSGFSRLNSGKGPEHSVHVC